MYYNQISAEQFKSTSVLCELIYDIFITDFF